MSGAGRANAIILDSRVSKILRRHASVIPGVIFSLWGATALTFSAYTAFLAYHIGLSLIDDVALSSLFRVHQRGGVVDTLYNSFLAVPPEGRVLWTSQLFQKALWTFWGGDTGAAHLTVLFIRYASAVMAYLLARRFVPDLSRIAVVMIVIKYWFFSSGRSRGSAARWRQPRGILHACFATVGRSCDW